MFSYSLYKLQYYNARYYDPVIGIFINSDPMLDGFNVYAYCKNNPVAYSDPSGFFRLKLGIGWSSDYGVSIGFGAAFDFKGEVGIGVNASYALNCDGSSTGTI